MSQDKCGIPRVPEPENRWNGRLRKDILKPELVVVEDDLVVVIRDKFPKASVHYLVCPRRDIDTLGQVTRDDVGLLRHMHAVGERLCARHEDLEFQLGYHSIPSMLRLHLHVVSRDFHSKSLKTIKHWNSFNTDYFLSSRKVIDDLEKHGRVLCPMSRSELENLLKSDLKCNRCEYRAKNLPNLKAHLMVHLDSKSVTMEQ